MISSKRIKASLEAKHSFKTWGWKATSLWQFNPAQWSSLYQSQTAARAPYNNVHLAQFPVHLPLPYWLRSPRTEPRRQTAHRTFQIALLKPNALPRADTHTHLPADGFGRLFPAGGSARDALFVVLQVTLRRGAVGRLLVEPGPRDGQVALGASSHSPHHHRHLLRTNWRSGTSYASFFRPSN